MPKWIFQGNPKQFTINKDKFPDLHDLNQYVKNGKIIDWSIRQKHHKNEIKVGDEVFLWRSDGGEKGTGGIIAIAEILTEPKEGEHIYPQVQLKIKEARLNENDGMVLRSKLKELPETRNLLIMRLPQLTNYKLTDEEFNKLLKFWNKPILINQKVNKSLIEKYLLFYKDEIYNYPTEFKYLEESYNFFQQFRDPEYIKTMEWEDFQKIGQHVNAYRMAIARSRAFGNMNAPIEKYRASFLYLVHGDDSLKHRMDQFLNNEQYKLFGIGANALSEMIGNIFPEDYCFFNQRDRVAVENELEIDPGYMRGDTFSERFMKFQKSIKKYDIAEKYQELIGRQTNLPIYYEVDQFFSFIFDKSKDQTIERDTPKYWLIAAGENSKYWRYFKDKEQVSIGWNELGDLRKYKDKKDILETLKEVNELDYSPTNDALANEQFVREMKEGDNVIVKQGKSKIIAFGQVTSQYQYDTENGPHHSYRNVDWLKEGEWDISSHPINQKTLTDVSDYEDFLDDILSKLEVKEPSGSDVVKEEKTEYTTEDITRDLFIDLDKLEDAIGSLEYKKNIILQGPPGVGKTFVAKRLAYYHMEVKKPENIEIVQFHQSYSYEEFIRGFKPNTEGQFVLQDGLFHKFCKRARENPDENFYFIIDEINRGNLSKIFGEVMMLIEADKRGKEFAIKTTYSQDQERFFIPENVYLIGTMNTADRSLALVDYALRRRFAFIDLEPGFHTESFNEFLQAKGISQGFIEHIISLTTDINNEIVKDKVNLGKGFEVGHSYFTPQGNIEDEQTWLERVIRLEVEPLLKEYWFDQEEKVDELLTRYQ